MERRIEGSSIKIKFTALCFVITVVIVFFFEGFA